MSYPAPHLISHTLPSLLPLAAALLLLCQAGDASAEQCVVIGDSLTKEYEVEFPILFPNNPRAWEARNWIEILHQHRGTWFDTGPWSGYIDPRVLGHEHNWGFPGDTTTDIRNKLYSSGSFWWIGELKGQIKNEAERVVIFAGGNDVDSYYGSIYHGAAPAGYTNVTLGNLQAIVSFVRQQKSTIPIVLAAVPHVGCTPEIMSAYPPDALKTGRVTAALETLNAQLAAYAQAQGIGFVPGVYELTKDLMDLPFRIGGVNFYKSAHPDAPPRYVFSGDGFHPGTCAHARLAQLVIEAFRARYPATNITPLTDRELVANVLGLDPNIPFTEWIATQSIPAGQTGLYDDPDGDGLKNVVEFALEGASAGTFTAQRQPWLEATPPDSWLAWNYHPNLIATEWGTVVPQYSLDLTHWQDVPPEHRTTGADGIVTVRLPASGRAYCRLLVKP